MNISTRNDVIIFMAKDVFFVFEYKQQHNIKMTASFSENKTVYLSLTRTRNG